MEETEGANEGALASLRLPSEGSSKKKKKRDWIVLDAATDICKHTHIELTTSRRETVFHRYKTVIIPITENDVRPPLVVYTLNYEQEHESWLGCIDEGLGIEMDESKSPVVRCKWEELSEAALLLAGGVQLLPMTEDLSNALTDFITVNRKVNVFSISVSPCEQVELELPE